MAGDILLPNPASGAGIQSDADWTQNGTQSGSTRQNYFCPQIQHLIAWPVVISKKIEIEAAAGGGDVDGLNQRRNSEVQVVVHCVGNRK